MDESLLNENLLMRYLDGELNSEEKAAFENKLRYDKALQNELQNLQLAVQAIRQYGTSQKVSAIHQEMMQELKGQRKGKVVSYTKFIRYSMAVAASVLVIFIGVRLYLNAQTSPERIYKEAFVDFNVSATRGDATGFSEIEKSYQQKNYEAVTKSTRARTLSAKDSLLIGLAYLQTNRSLQAINFFRQLATSENSYQQDAEFYLSLAFLKAGNYSQALVWMRKIASNPSHLYREQVGDDLLENVEQLNRK